MAYENKIMFSHRSGGEEPEICFPGLRLRCQQGCTSSGDPRAQETVWPFPLVASSAHQPPLASVYITPDCLHGHKASLCLSKDSCDSI